MINVKRATELQDPDHRLTWVLHHLPWVGDTSLMPHSFDDESCSEHAVMHTWLSTCGLFLIGDDLSPRIDREYPAGVGAEDAEGDRAEGYFVVDAGDAFEFFG